MIKKILYITLLLIGILGIIDSLFVMKISVGLSAGVIAPGLIGIVLILYAILKLKLKGGRIIKRPVLRKIIIIGICLIVLIFAVIEGLIISTAYSKKAQYTQTNYVIVLGCGIFSDGQLTLTLMKRLNAAYDYLINNPETICIVSGGQGPNEPTTEAYAMNKYLVELGIDEDKIIQEGKSTSTDQNLQYSYDIISTYNKEPTVAIATSDFHVFRTNLLAKKHGLDPIGLPCTTTWYIWINCYLREFLAVIKSLLFDSLLF